VATAPTPEHAARAILAFYIERNNRAGDTIQPRQVGMQLQQNGGLNADEIQNGVEYGIEQGWFEMTDKQMLRLTDKGYEAA
jgi:hypothetical protein